jgi:ubiquinol-cytochrome c reductase iron-sulfur subunit
MIGRKRGTPATTDVTAPNQTVDRPPEIPLTGSRSDELLVSFFFLLSAGGAVWFFVTYWIHAKTDNFVNAMYGLSLAVCLGGLGVGAILWAKKLMPHEEAVQERHPFGSPPEDVAGATEAFRAGVEGSGIVRRPILRRSLLLASSLLVLPLIAPLRSLGEKPKGELKHTRWTPGARMVLFDGTLVKLGDLEQNGVVTVFPEHHTDVDSAADSSVLLINIGEQNLTAKTRQKASQGYVAYSQICTHAGCPARLYSQQTRILLCPCHQSQFSVVEGCKPIAGPATRSLPQLALTVDSDGYFRAVRDFDEPVGPGFWERS